MRQEIDHQPASTSRAAPVRRGHVRRGSAFRRRSALISQLAPRPLFGSHLVTTAGLGFRAEYDVTADGQRFIVNQIAEGDAPPPITVIVNWQSLLKK